MVKPKKQKEAWSSSGQMELVKLDTPGQCSFDSYAELRKNDEARQTDVEELLSDKDLAYREALIQRKRKNLSGT